MRPLPSHHYSKLAGSRLSCRDAILDAIDRLHHRTGATAFARRDIVAEVHCADHGFERQTIYRCIRRITGHEAGSAHQDLEDVGNGKLRRRGDSVMNATGGASGYRNSS